MFEISASAIFLLKIWKFSGISVFVESSQDADGDLASRQPHERHGPGGLDRESEWGGSHTKWVISAEIF